MKKFLHPRIKSILIYLLIIGVTIEVSPYLAGPVFLGKKFSRGDLKAELFQQAQKTETTKDTVAELQEGYLSEHIVHPYLGFVHLRDSYYNTYGFPLDGPIAIHSENVINICITGGSVAKQLFQNSRDDLVNSLKKHPLFSGKEIKVYCVALGGFKQPQQVLAITYFLSLGAQYDYVINLDGFNEVVLPYSDNLPFKIFPSFPRHWNVYSRKILDKRTTLLLGKQAVFMENQQVTAANFSESFLRFSNFGLFIWKLLDQRQLRNIVATELLLRDELRNSEMGIQTSGPAYSSSDTSSFFLEQARYWSQCSRQIQALAEHFGFSYLHFLQPNQYVEGSKNLTSEEITIAFEAGDFAYKKAVGIAYPMLVNEGLLLQQEGISFTDLTQLFSDEKATVYADKCCHFNKRGYDTIVDEIVKAITSGS